MIGNYKMLSLLIIAMMVAMGCNQKVENSKIEASTVSERESDITGDYVSEGYLKRNDGYDWIAVSVSESESNKLKISIRSRADKKKPSCTFDAIAEKVNDKTYESRQEGATIIFEFNKQSIDISAKEEDQNILNYYCSGGASIAGSYKKIDEPLDQSQIDKSKFKKVLNLQGVGFNVISKEENQKNTLTIITFGLEKKEFHETFEIEGEEVTNAEVEDLNSDGSPELFVYTQSVDSGNYGKVYAFSVNSMKSMSAVYFEPTSNKPKINQGYRGHDQFSLIENRLAQRFPVYDKDDLNLKSSVKTRQVSYKLVEGEAMRKLEVDKVIEY